MRSPIRHRLLLAQLLLAPLIVAPAADAGMLYKCSTPKGAVTIRRVCMSGVRRQSGSDAASLQLTRLRPASGPPAGVTRRYCSR